jgi:2-phosphoglycerate kinase
MPPYQHGEDTRSIAAISIDPQLLEEAVQIDVDTHHYEILTSEELEEKIKLLEEKQNEEEPQRNEAP